MGTLHHLIVVAFVLLLHWYCSSNEWLLWHCGMGWVKMKKVALMVHGYIKSSWVKHGVCMSWVCSNMSFHIFSFALCWKETPHIFFLKNSQTILGCFGGTWENIFDRNKALFQSYLGQRHLSIPILSWSPNSNYLYFWYLFVDRQIQKTPSSSAGQQDLRERSPCCFFRPSAWLSSN